MKGVGLQGSVTSIRCRIASKTNNNMVLFDRLGVWNSPCEIVSVLRR
jgi:hypothetical protein